MKNSDVVAAFYEGKCAKTKNLESIGNKLISYNTTIAERIKVKGKIVIIKNTTRYSTSTSKHQGYITKYDYIAFDVPRSTVNLIKYI